MVEGSAGRTTWALSFRASVLLYTGIHICHRQIGAAMGPVAAPMDGSVQRRK